MSGQPASAMVFAAGFGTRMGSLTDEIPKPMLPLGGRPMIDHTIERLREAGVETIVSNTHYLHERIAPHLATLGVSVSHEESELLDTGGGLKAALPLLSPGPVITMNPDAAWRGPNPVEVLLSAWRPDLEALLLVLPETKAVARSLPGDFGMQGTCLKRIGSLVYTGLQIINPRLLDQVQDTIFSLNRIWDILISRDALHGVLYPGSWCDIGHPEGLAAAEELMGSRDV